ncbi:MAG: sugar transporter [Halochromatium sp.]|nr:sugar transporter [Halochromatium sp.]
MRAKSSKQIGWLTTISLCLCMLSLVVSCSSTRHMERATVEEIMVERASFSFDNNENFDRLPYYRIQPGDVLDVFFQIETWSKADSFKIAVDHTVKVNFIHTPELDTEQSITPDGKIVLPYLGAYSVIDKTPDEVADELTAAYQGVLRDPEIYVTVPSFQRSIEEFKQDLRTAPRGLSRLATVRPDGYITFPLIGEYDVAGLTIPEANERMNQDYAKIIQGLRVDLFLQENAGSRIFILGEVEESGSYPIGKPIPIAKALALAQGFTNEAKLDSVIVARQLDDKIAVTKIDMTHAGSLGGYGALFYLMPDDLVFVPRTRLSTTAQIMSEISDVLMFRGWSFGIDGISVEGTSASDINFF